MAKQSLNEVQAALVDIACDGRRASDVVGAVRAGVDDVRSERQLVDMNSVIKEVLSVAQPDFVQHIIVISINVPLDLPPVSGHRARLYTVVYNLVRNAIEAMETVPDGARRLTIRAWLDESGRVAVTLKNQRCRIEERSLERIFDMYVTTKPGHLGLGLRVSRSVL